MQIPYNGHMIVRKPNPAAQSAHGQVERFLFVVTNARTQQKLGIFRTLDAAVRAVDRAGVLVH